ncbi:DUF6668 family protein [Glutamicibacter sp. BW80]|uniref:DUF6668 family protein n=1 Tax=Glutamicibacter sp. BW80 TaxID=2024404 RepID=UPI001142E52C|nr:DUF6668 family protein [Glutamicibacter sp. BW80]
MVETSELATLWCLGTHGGSGETRIASQNDDWRGANHSWPVSVSGTVKVLLLARSHMSGLRAAQRAIIQWASGLVPNVEVIGLAIVADAPGRLPRALRDTAQVVGGGVPRIWHLPWIESWRLEESSNSADQPRELRKFLKEISSLIDPYVETLPKKGNDDD